MKEQSAYQIESIDNVATALEECEVGEVQLLGNCTSPAVYAGMKIPKGHKIAVRDIEKDEDIVKYGVVIGRSTEAIPAGAWVHLHVMRSLYDERSSHLDPVTGAPRDITYG